MVTFCLGTGLIEGFRSTLVWGGEVTKCLCGSGVSSLVIGSLEMFTNFSISAEAFFPFGESHSAQTAYQQQGSQ